ncbi:MAG: Gfo/Idh/MocA family oxidoreductase [Caldilineaceae bacterium]|nr:Gfo/Idh/MocA family oxidoreductase [Caldilineaceae bacterium]
MKTRIGLIGCGRIGEAHAEGYRLAPELCQVTVCCDEWSLEQAQRVAGRFPGAAAVDDWRAVIERDDVDAVDICMPNHMHHEIALAAAAAGKHAIVEKPFGLTLAEAREMVDASDRAGKILMAAQNQRFMAEHMAVKKWLDQGVIGRVVAVRFDCNQFLAKMYPEGSWMFSKAKTGGGMVITTAIHKLDLMRHFFGEIKQVSSFQARTGLNHNMDNEDVAAIILEFENGIIGEGFYLFAAHKTPSHPHHELTIIYGEKGVIHNVMGWHIYSTDVPEYSGGLTRVDLPQDPYRDSIVREVRHYLECIRDNVEPLTSGRDNLGTMAVIDAIYQAAETNSVVMVDHS